jgi:hypothetical protein
MKYVQSYVPNTESSWHKKNWRPLSTIILQFKPATQIFHAIHIAVIIHMLLRIHTDTRHASLQFRRYMHVILP